MPNIRNGSKGGIRSRAHLIASPVIPLSCHPTHTYIHTKTHTHKHTCKRCGAWWLSGSKMSDSQLRARVRIDPLLPFLSLAIFVLSTIIQLYKSVVEMWVNILRE